MHNVISDNKRNWPRIFALVYLFIAGMAAWQTVEHTRAATHYFDQGLDKFNLKNVGAQLLPRINSEHLIVGRFFSASIQQSFDLPSFQDSSHELGDTFRLSLLVKHESSIAAWCSWLLLSVSLIYLAVAIAVNNSFRASNVLFALTSISAIFFVIGITAPAMVILTSPNVPIESGNFTFVLQHEVRSIFSVLVGLFSSGHWVIGILIATFSIVTPLIKISLTFVAATTTSSSVNAKISKFLHTIGKWSMADVFVAAMLLACFALQSQEATKVIACRGLNYFIGYCLLSMVTTLLLVNPDFSGENKSPNFGKKLGVAAVGGLFGAVLFLIIVAGIYTFEKHPAAPIEINSSQVNLKAHHWQKISLSVPHPGTLTIELRITQGNPIDVALIPADQLSNVELVKAGIQAEKLLRASLPAFSAVQATLYTRTSHIDKGEFLIILHDTTLGFLAASSSGIEIHAYLAH
jgi:paraquat-inducible protein A